MKNLRKSTMLMFILFGMVFRLYSQTPYLDSVNVQLGNKMEINMKIFSYDSLSATVTRDLKSLQTILLERKDIPSQGTYAITYVPDTRLSIKPGIAGERIIWDKGGMTRYTFDNRLSILSELYQLQIQFNDPAEIFSEQTLKNLEDVIDSVFSIKSRLSTTYHFSTHEGKMVRNAQLDKVTGQKDVLVLNGGVGVNLIKGQPVIDLSAQLGLIFCKKSIWKHQYYLSYSQLSYFSDLSSPKLNGFLSIGYKYNMSNTIGKPNWLGMEVGYLVSRNGDLLQKNTMRLGFNWDVAKFISVAPQLYMSGDFKELFPAVRIGFGF
ncbi:MAG: hypothetical protein IPH84_17595 [Bacteroidales bacterium]|nr:hypothetical protein [Bacteroidales bacterium]